MTMAEVGLALSLFLFVLALALFVRFTKYRNERDRIYRYRLFEVRDKLVQMVAEESVAEDDKAFQFLYQTVNRLIPVVKPPTLRQVVNVLKETPMVDPLRDKMLEALRHSSPEVRAAAAELFSAVLGILWERSFLVRLVFTVQRTWWRLLGLLRSSHVFSNQNVAYEVYRDVAEASERLESKGSRVSV